MSQDIPRTADALVESVYLFNKIAGACEPGRFNAERVCFYTGMQLEELGEKITAIAIGAVDQRERETLATLAGILAGHGKDFKANKHYGAVLRADREELIDGDIDQLVVSLGSLVYATPHFRPAIGEVLRANADKAPNGVATRDENGKVMKPEGWTKPNLAPFVDHHGQE